MNPGLLCLNDAHIRLFDSRGLRLADHATLIALGNHMTRGEAAQAICRIHPTHSFNQHWAQLNQTPFSRSLPGYRHNADLAFFQLNHWLQQTDADRLVIAHSLSYDAGQLALLAGLVQATGKQASAFVNQALLHGAAAIDEGLQASSFFHLDLSLHSARLTELHWQQGALAVAGQTVIADQGLAPLYQQWLKRLARECIRQTRYDPLHSAEAEQQLFNLLPHSVEQLQAGDGLLALAGHSLELQQSWLWELTQSLRTEVQNRISQAPLLLTPTAHWLPGLNGTPVTDAHTQHGFECLKSSLSGPLQDYKSIRLAAAADSAAVAPATVPSPAGPTHLLQGHTALPLRDGLSLYAGPGQFRLTAAPDKNGQAATLVLQNGQWFIEPGTLALSLNGAPLRQRQALAAGDRLVAGDASLLLIQTRQDAPHGP